MSSAQLWFARPGVQVREGKKGNTIRYFGFVAGKRYTAPCRIDYALAVNPKTKKATKILEQDYAKWLLEIRDEHGIPDAATGLRVPTCDELIDAYERIATERSRNPMFLKPGETAINTAMKNWRYCCEAAGLTGDRPVSALFDTKVLQGVLDTLAKRMKPISAWSMLCGVKSVTAYWTIDKYADLGYKVEAPRLPAKPKQAEAPQYKMMAEDLRKKVDAWYVNLGAQSGKDVRLAASMMYQLAVRPIDLPLLTAENFVNDPDGMVHLVYMPHKTQNSSGRTVDWPILPALWEEIREIAGDRLDAGKPLIGSLQWTMHKLNLSMRAACGISGAKAAYELRKLCVDTIRRTMGIDAAVAISGDRPETVNHYYADPYKMVGVKPIAIGPIG